MDLCENFCIINNIDHVLIFQGKTQKGHDKNLFCHMHIHASKSTHKEHKELLDMWYGMSGIDITAFAAHSTQSVPTLTASNMGLSIKDSQKAAVWSGDSTFIKYYSLTILKNFG